MKRLLDARADPTSASTRRSGTRTTTSISRAWTKPARRRSGARRTARRGCDEAASCRTARIRHSDGEAGRASVNGRRRPRGWRDVLACLRYRSAVGRAAAARRRRRRFGEGFAALSSSCARRMLAGSSISSMSSAWTSTARSRRDSRRPPRRRSRATRDGSYLRDEGR